MRVCGCEHHTPKFLYLAPGVETHLFERLLLLRERSCCGNTRIYREDHRCFWVLCLCVYVSPTEVREGRWASCEHGESLRWCMRKLLFMYCNTMTGNKMVQNGKRKRTKREKRKGRRVKVSGASKMAPNLEKRKTLHFCFISYFFTSCGWIFETFRMIQGYSFQNLLFFSKMRN